MTSTVFSSGTVITAPWLNDVNTKTYADTSNTVAYTPAGTGAVATTVQTKERQIISVFDFFTAAQIADVNSCTASIDTRDAINAAIEYAYTFVVTQTVFDEYGWQSRGGATIYFPPGKYLTSSGPIQIRPNVSLKGNGKSSSVIYSTYNGIICEVKQASKSGEYNQAGITIQDLMVIGNRATTSTQTAFDLQRPVGMKMIGVVINSCSSDGMILREVSNSTFIDVEIANCGGCGLRIMQGSTGLPSNANTFISPRILYNDGDGLILQEQVNGNTFIGGSIERNGYATTGVGFYNVKITSNSYQPNHFIDLWTEGPCDAHVLMNSSSGTGAITRFTGWKHFGDGTTASPNRALINTSGYAIITQPTASSVSYKIINSSNSPFRVNKAGGAAIIYLEDPYGATITSPINWIEDENGNHTGLYGIAYLRDSSSTLGPQTFYNDNGAANGVAYKNDTKTYPWYQSRSFYTDLLLGTGDATPSAGISAGNGSPQGSKTASPGSIYMNMSGGAGTSFYVKESGTGNTGWVAK
ncbi:Pectate lyase superfamily protein [uncultured Caudovirales phage]|uniref:Pectate lyase superfamily protein n=1 Tax=uncultured Caudovirales phage TaxID=2100421 RepID=A0A6J5LHC6_9CAUD|nr:Pectate lyase superfamily protein [uncultured Caudovirales phage]